MIRGIESIMSCFKSDVEKDKLCGIIIEALKSGPKSNKELFLISKDKYAEFLKRYSLGVIVSDSEIRYRIRRLLKDGLISRHHAIYSASEKASELKWLL